MIAVDTNVLVYAHRAEVIWHRAAFATVKLLAESSARWAITWPSIHEFISVVTNKKLHALPTPLTLAFSQIRHWTDAGNLILLGEDSNHLDTLETLALPAGLSGAKIHDARIAAICLQHGVSELWTADRDFSLFPALKTRNPLVS